MDNQEARFILQAYRPDGRDATDPVFREALEVARRDPDLSVWLAGEQALDAALSQKLREVPVPASLKPSILAGLHVSQKIHWWRQSSVWAMAASLALLIGSIVLIRTHTPPTLTVAEFRDNSAAYVPKIELQHQSSNIAELQSWLRNRNSPSGANLPAAVSKTPPVGCRTLNWNGRQVALICFNGTPEAHLFIVRSSDLRDAPVEGRPQFAQVAGMATATWTKGGETYVLASNGTKSDLEKFL